MSKSLLALSEVPDEKIVSYIYLIRGQKVMLDKDLAELYGVEVKRLNEAVKRNKARFTQNYMFQLSGTEWQNLKSQIATSSWGGARTLPYAFTEHGVLALSFVLRSEIAIQVSDRILSVYVKMRHLLADNKEIWQRIENIERRMEKKDEEVQAIFKLFKQFMIKEEKPRTQIGFKLPAKKKKK